MSSKAYDTIVIGAGHNGLTTAALLGKAGRKVLVLERRDRIGGLAAAEEFHPGYRTGGVLHDTSLVRPSVIQGLALEQHGLKLRSAPASVLALGSGDDEPLLVHGQVDRAAEAIAGVSPGDGDRYRGFKALMRRLAPAVQELFGRAPIDLIDVESESIWDLGKRAIRVRRLGKADMMELVRLPPMCVADVLREHFDSHHLQAALALPSLLGTFTGPWSPGNAINLLRLECLGGPGVEGGGPALVEALRKAAEAAGVEIRTEAEVKRLRLDGEGIAGVELADGETIDATRVAASCTPWHTFVELMPPGGIAHRFEHRVRTLRCRGSVGQVRLALRTPPAFAEEGVEVARTGAHLDDLERAYDAIKYRRESEAPILDIHLASSTDPTAAPEGHASLNVTVYFVPNAREGGWDEAAREAVGDRVVQTLAGYDAALPDAIVAREVLTPVELEQRYGLHGGDVFHGEHSLDQLMIRPTPECIHYRTPVDGLYLCGSGSHPGGGLSCGPGELAAQAMLSAKK